MIHRNVKSVGVLDLCEGYDRLNTDGDCAVDEHLKGIGGNMYQGNQFEKIRMSSSSSLVSQFPHVSSQITPTLGPDSLPQWFSPIYVFMAYSLMYVFEGALYSFAVSGLFITYPGTDPSSVLIKATSTSVVVALIQVGFSKWVGGYCDPFISMMVGFMEMFFDKRWKDTNSYGIMQKALVIVKILFNCLFNFIGFLIGFAVTAVSHGGPVTTSDCLMDYAPICLAKPVPVFVGESEAKWQVVLGSLLIPSSIMIAYGLNKKKTLWVKALTYTGINYLATDANGELTKKYNQDTKRARKANTMRVPWDINDDSIMVGCIVGLAHFLSVVLYSRNVGYGFNFWYWLVSSIFTGDYSHSSTYAWPMLLSCVVVFVMHALWFLLSDRAIDYRRKKFEENQSDQLTD